MCDKWVSRGICFRAPKPNPVKSSFTLSLYMHAHIYTHILWWWFIKASDECHCIERPWMIHFEAMRSEGFYIH
jgi:hypothetical protein